MKSKRPYDGLRDKQFFLPVRDRRVFDDDILNESRVKRVMKGSVRRLHLSSFEKPYGSNWETFCRSVMALSEFYALGGNQIAFRDSIVEAANVVEALSQSSTLNGALSAGIDVEMLDGLIYKPFLIAWCAVCHVLGAESLDCKNLYNDNSIAISWINKSFFSFDKLSNKRYNDIDVFDLKNNERN